MRLTFERHKNSASIYIYFREFDSTRVSTITNFLGHLLFDSDNQWIGIEVVNIRVEEEKIQLPRLKNPYVTKQTERFSQNEEKIIAVFDTELKAVTRQPVYCNIDYSEVNGLQGVEVLVENFTGTMDVANQYI